MIFVEFLKAFHKKKSLVKSLKEFQRLFDDESVKIFRKNLWIVP